MHQKPKHRRSNCFASSVQAAQSSDSEAFETSQHSSMTPVRPVHSFKALAGPHHAAIHVLLTRCPSSRSALQAASLQCRTDGAAPMWLALIFRVFSCRMSSRIFLLPLCSSSLTCPTPRSFHSPLPLSLSNLYSLHLLRAHTCACLKPHFHAADLQSLHLLRATWRTADLHQAVLHVHVMVRACRCACWVCAAGCTTSIELHESAPESMRMMLHVIHHQH